MNLIHILKRQELAFLKTGKNVGGDQCPGLAGFGALL